MEKILFGVGIGGFILLAVLFYVFSREYVNDADSEEEEDIENQKRSRKDDFPDSDFE